MNPKSPQLKYTVQEPRTTPAGKPLSGKTVVATHRGHLVGHVEHGYDSVVLGHSLPDQSSVDAAHAGLQAHAKENGIESTGMRTV